MVKRQRRRNQADGRFGVATTTETPGRNKADECRGRKTAIVIDTKEKRGTEGEKGKRAEPYDDA